MHNLKAHAITTITIIVSALLLSLFVASIHQIGLINNNGYETAVNVVGIITFLLAGLLLGFNVKKHGFLHAFLFASLYILIIFLIVFLSSNKGLGLEGIVFTLIKGGTLIIGAVIGRNLKY